MSSLNIPKIDGVDGARCFVTGAAGFIGSTLTRVLLKSGAAEVIAFDNLATGQQPILACRQWDRNALAIRLILCSPQGSNSIHGPSSRRGPPESTGRHGH